MQQTEHYGLNQWDPADRILRQDFNADNLKIAEALAGKMGQIEVFNQREITANSDSIKVSCLSGSWDDWAVIGVWYIPKLRSEAGVGTIEVCSGDGLVYAHVDPSPFVLLLFPLHDGTRQIRGVILSSTFKVFTCDDNFNRLRFMCANGRNGCQFAGCLSESFGIR